MLPLSKTKICLHTADIAGCHSQFMSVLILLLYGSVPGLANYDAFTLQPYYLGTDTNFQYPLQHSELQSVFKGYKTNNQESVNYCAEFWHCYETSFKASITLRSFCLYNVKLKQCKNKVIVALISTHSVQVHCMCAHRVAGRLLLYQTKWGGTV